MTNYQKKYLKYKKKYLRYKKKMVKKIGGTLWKVDKTIKEYNIDNEDIDTLEDLNNKFNESTNFKIKGFSWFPLYIFLKEVKKLYRFMKSELDDLNEKQNLEFRHTRNNLILPQLLLGFLNKLKYIKNYEKHVRLLFYSNMDFISYYINKDLKSIKYPQYSEIVSECQEDEQKLIECLSKKADEYYLEWQANLAYVIIDIKIDNKLMEYQHEKKKEPYNTLKQQIDDKKIEILEKIYYRYNNHTQNVPEAHGVLEAEAEAQAKAQADLEKNISAKYTLGLEEHTETPEENERMTKLEEEIMRLKNDSYYQIEGEYRSDKWYLEQHFIASTQRKLNIYNWEASTTKTIKQIRKYLNDVVWDMDREEDVKEATAKKSPWEQRWNDLYKSFYYFNTKTGKTAAFPPKEGYDPVLWREHYKNEVYSYTKKGSSKETYEFPGEGRYFPSDYKTTVANKSGQEQEKEAYQEKMRYFDLKLIRDEIIPWIKIYLDEEIKKLDKEFGILNSLFSFRGAAEDFGIEPPYAFDPNVLINVDIDLFDDDSLLQFRYGNTHILRSIEDINYAAVDANNRTAGISNGVFWTRWGSRVDFDSAIRWERQWEPEFKEYNNALENEINNAAGTEAKESKKKLDQQIEDIKSKQANPYRDNLRKALFNNQ